MKNKEKELNMEKEKLEIIKWVTSLNDEVAIEKLRMLRKSPKRRDWWDEITEEEKMAIEKGLEDVRAGKVKPHKEARKLYEQWL